MSSNTAPELKRLEAGMFSMTMYRWLDLAWSGMYGDGWGWELLGHGWGWELLQSSLLVSSSSCSIFTSYWRRLISISARRRCSRHRRSSTRVGQGTLATSGIWTGTSSSNLTCLRSRRVLSADGNLRAIAEYHLLYSTNGR